MKAVFPPGSTLPWAPGRVVTNDEAAGSPIQASKRAQGTTVLTAFNNPIPLSLQYVKGGGGASYFPVSAITDRL